MIMTYMLNQEQERFLQLPHDVQYAFEAALLLCANVPTEHFNMGFLGFFTAIFKEYQNEVYEALDLMDGNGFQVNYTGSDNLGVEVSFDIHKLMHCVEFERMNAAGGYNDN